MTAEVFEQSRIEETQAACDSYEDELHYKDLTALIMTLNTIDRRLEEGKGYESVKEQLEQCKRIVKHWHSTMCKDQQASMRIFDFINGSGSLEKWQPIETAPRDGTEILVIDATWFNAKINQSSWKNDKFDKEHGGWWDGFSTCYRPTHWQPLPSPPNKLGIE